VLNLEYLSVGGGPIWLVGACLADGGWTRKGKALSLADAVPTVIVTEGNPATPHHADGGSPMGWYANQKARHESATARKESMLASFGSGPNRCIEVYEDASRR
jgi:hypothetical protein